jgi:hypothetical protein
VLAATGEVAMLNAAESTPPAATVTEAGVVAAGLLLVSVTTAPPCGAGLARETVFDAVELPPRADAGDKFTSIVDPAGTSVKVLVAVTPL